MLKGRNYSESEVNGVVSLMEALIKEEVHDRISLLPVKVVPLWWIQRHVPVGGVKSYDIWIPRKRPEPKWAFGPPTCTLRREEVIVLLETEWLEDAKKFIKEVRYGRSD